MSLNSPHLIPLHSTCRACLQQQDGMKNLLDDAPDIQQLQVKFAEISNLELVLSENLPRFLCRHCELQLNQAYEFRQLCQKSNELLSKCCTDTIEQLQVDQPAEMTAECQITRKKSRNKLQQFPANEVQDFIQQVQLNFSQPMNCVLCDFESSNRRALSFHMTKIHREEKKTWCIFCNALYDDLQQHKQENGCKQNNLLCKFCNKEFYVTSHLMEHLFYHTSVKQNTCSVCKKSFLTARQLKVHSKTHLEFEKDRDLEDEQDGPPRKHLCTYCGKSFNFSGRLTVHLRSHTGHCPYKCQDCPKSFTTRAQLVNHQRVHSGEKPHICSFCGKAFSQTSILRTHLKQHTGRTEQCQFCPKTFCRPSELKLHLRVHTGERPYHCHVCDQTFISKINLTNHLVVHSDQRPYQCQHCDKAFKSSSTLKSHEQIHMGVKPYKCQLCNYASRQKHSLTQHIQNNHQPTEKTILPNFIIQEIIVND